VHDDVAGKEHYTCYWLVMLIDRSKWFAISNFPPFIVLVSGLWVLGMRNIKPTIFMWILLCVFVIKFHAMVGQKIIHKNILKFWVPYIKAYQPWKKLFSCMKEPNWDGGMRSLGSMLKSAIIVCLFCMYITFLSLTFAESWRAFGGVPMSQTFYKISPSSKNTCCLTLIFGCLTLHLWLKA
jgi:hypothetical protein